MATIDERLRQGGAADQPGRIGPATPPAPRASSFGDAAAAARNRGVTQLGQTGAPPADAQAPVPLGQMHSVGGRNAAQMLASGLDSGARAFFNSFGPSPEKGQAVPAPVAPNPTDQRLAAGTQTAPMGAAAMLAAVPAATTDPAAPSGNVTRVGNSYSGTDIRGDITVNGKTPGGGYMAAGEQLRALGAGAGGAPGGVTGVQAPTVRHSGNSWQAQNDLRNARVSASSIMNNGGRFDQHGKGVVSPERAAYLAMLGTDQALRQAQPGMDQTAMRENAGLQREGMQQTGANARTALTAGLDQQRLGLEQTAAGFKTRAAQRLEGLQSAYQSAKTDAERGALARQIREIQGTENGDQWKAVALQGGTDAQGNKTESILGAVNERTGEMKRMEAGPRVPAISENAQAISIRDNPSLTREQKVEALRKLGYS